MENQDLKAVYWNDFAEALKDKFGESLIDEEEDEDDPMNWWLTDVTVQDIVEFARSYYNKEALEKTAQKLFPASPQKRKLWLEGAEWHSDGTSFE